MKRGGYEQRSRGFTLSITRQWHSHDSVNQSYDWFTHPNGASGFTIVETMIVLAVSGIMLLSTIALIAGKQNRTQFQSALNEAASQLQQTTREVGIGYYPDINQLQCTTLGAKVNITTGGSLAQGANQNCVFLGKVVQFGVGDNNGSEDMAVYVLAGCQFTNCATGSTPSTTPANAKAVVIERSNTNTFPSATTYNQLQNGLTTLWVHYYSALAPTIPIVTREFAALQSQGTFGGSCTGECGGSQQFALYGIKDSLANPVGTKGNLATSASMLDDPANYVPTQKITICLLSGTTGQSGLLSLSGDGNAITTTIFNGNTCS